MSEALDRFERTRQQQAAIRARVAAEAEIRTTPDEAARAARDARIFGAPVPLVTAAPDMYAARRAADEAEDAALRSPKVSPWLNQQAGRAALARGSMGNMADTANHLAKAPPPQSALAKLGQWVSSRMDPKAIAGVGPLRGLFGMAAAAGRTGGDLALTNIPRDVAVGVPVLAGDILLGGPRLAQSLLADYSPISLAEEALFGRNSARETAESIKGAQTWYDRNVVQELRRPTETREGAAIQAGFESAGANLVGLGLSAATRSAWAGATLIATQTGFRSSSEALDAGLSSGVAVVHGGFDAAVELATEYLPEKYLLGGLLKNTRADNWLVKFIGAEMVGEQLATLFQDFNRWAGIDANNGKTFGEFLDERPAAARDTALATIAGAGATAALVQPLRKVAQKFGRRLPQAEAAEAQTEFVRQLNQLAAAIEIAARDPASFAEFVDYAAEGTEVADVYVEAARAVEVFNQDDLTDDDLILMTGMNKAELATAAERGEDIAIPVGVYAAHVATTPYAAPLLDHLRIEPGAMSKAQATEYLKGVEQELETEMQAAVDAGRVVDLHRQSEERVRDAVMAELTRANRFTSEVHETYAKITARMFARMADRWGVLPEEMAARLGLKVSADPAVQPTYGQGGKPTLNIGLDVGEEMGGGAPLTPDEVRQAITEAGYTITRDDVRQSESEQTLIAELDREPSEEDVYALSERLRQKAIAAHTGQRGFLAGPMKDAWVAEWGDFNPDYFLTLDRGPAQDQDNGDGRGRSGDRGGAALAGAPKVGGEVFGPIAALVAVAENYAARAGIPYRRQARYVEVDEERARRIADAYAAMAHAPGDPQVAEAYADLIRQTRAQYDALVEAGYVFVFGDPDDPYFASGWNALRDLRDNKRMAVFPTAAGFGSDASFDPADNPLLADTGLRWPGPDGTEQTVYANDLFRAVHDAFGHGLEGAGFRAQGEENAWQAHARLFTGPALGALTSETRGQNSWLNYGPHGESNRNAPVEDTVFADQKTGLMPAWTWQEGLDGQEGETFYQSAENVVGFAHVAPYLTEEERAGLKAKAAEKLLSIFTRLPDAEEMAAVAVAGRAKRGWYRRSAEAIVEVFGAADGTRFAALLAALSPQTSVESNAINALRVWTAWDAAGRPTDRKAIVRIMGESVQGGKGVGSVLNAWINNSVSALTTGDLAELTLSGPKVNSFWLNLIGELDEVTNDTWMANYALMHQSLFKGKGGPDNGKGAGYLAMNALVRRAAEIATERTGDVWTPAEIQETVWAWTKRLTEGTPPGASAQELLAAGGLTHEDLANSADFALLFTRGVFRRVLEEAGYGRELEALDAQERRERLAGADAPTGSVANAEGTGFDADAFVEHLANAAARVDQRRDYRPSAQLDLFATRVFNQDDDTPLDPEMVFKRENVDTDRAVRLPDNTVLIEGPDWYSDQRYQERLAKVAERLGVTKIEVAKPSDPRFARGVPLWHTRPPIQPDGTIRLDHWALATETFTRTDPTRWGESGTLPRSERSSITSSLPRTYFGIASGEPGGYQIEFPRRARYEARVDAARLYDIASDPDGLKQGDGANALERRVQAAGYAGYWTKNDQLGLVAVVFEPLDVRPSTATVFNQDALFYSALERTIERSTQTKASGAQWAATLRKAPGVKQDEMGWTGLLDFLAGTEGSIPREDLLALVRAQGIQIEEIVQGYDRREGPFTIETIPTQFGRWSSSQHKYGELLLTLPLGVRGNPKDAPGTHWDQDAVVLHIRFSEVLGEDGVPVLKIEEVQSDWHQKGRDQGYETSETSEDVRARERIEQRIAEAEARRSSAMAAETLAEQKLNRLAAPVLRAGYEAAMADIRAKAAEHPDAFNADFVEHMDKALRQQLLVNFYANKSPGYLGMGNLRQPLYQAKIALQGLPDEIEALVAEIEARRGEVQGAQQDLDLAHREWSVYRTAKRGIPDAPFKTSWASLAMKRMIRWAADHGYQKIVWTTGQEQAERYNLGEATGDILVAEETDEDGTEYLLNLRFGAMTVLVNNGLAARSGNNIRMTEAQMQEAFGGEVAKRIVEGQAAHFGGGAEGPFTLPAGGLFVGGEGMRAFYDRNLVNITNGIVKRYGVKVAPVRAFTDPQQLDDRNFTARQRADADALAPVDSAAAERLYELANLRDAEGKGAGVTHWGFDVTPEMAQDALGGIAMFQKEQAQPRGQIAFPANMEEGPSIISLLRGANLSTYLHELGHFYFEALNHMAAQPGAPASIVEDRDILLRHLGVASATEWEKLTPSARRTRHEQVARTFEAYLWTGKAPSVELRGLFGTLRRWMRDVYKLLRELKAPLTDEVKGVFDRMLASEEQIAEEQADLEMQALFREKPEGMSDADWEDYQRLNQDATEEAGHQLEQRSLRDMRYAGRAMGREIKRLQKEVALQRRAVREEVEQELAALPVYRAAEFLRTGKIDGEAVEGDHRLLTEEVRVALKLEKGDPLPKALAGMTSTEHGVHPNQIAELFGFTSADHLLKDLLFASPLREAVEAETDARMHERYGELSSPEALEATARLAVHNDVRGRFVATELAALQNAPGKKRVLDNAARRLAVEHVNRLRVRDLRPGQYEAAERRSAREAVKAGAGKLVEAVRAKRNQLFNFHLAKAAHEAADEARAIREYLRKFDKESVRKALDPDFRDQIDALLERYELRAISNREADKRKDIREWVEAMRAEGFEPAIDPDTLAAIMRQPWRDLTVEQLRTLRDAIKNMEHLARLTKKLLTAKDKADLDTAAAEIAETVRANAFKETPDILGPKTWWERRKSDIADFFAAHRKFANLAYVMDGNRPGGAVWERFIRPMNAAGDKEATMNRAVGDRLGQLFRQLGRDTTTKTYIPAIGRSLSLEGRVMVALNWGNSANRQRLLDGNKWEPAQAEAVLATLTAEQWDFVEQVWEYLDSFWPEVVAKERRVAGVEPGKVEAEPFQLEIDGTLRLLRGGYFPIKYDPDKSSKAEADTAAEVYKQVTQGLYTRATTRRGHTKARVESVNRALRLDFGVVFEHVAQVVHDLAWHEWLVDANRLLRHRAVDAAIRDAYGPETLRTIRKLFEDIAVGDIPAQDALDRAVNYIRTGATVAGLAWNLWTSLLQPIGLTQSAARIGTQWVLKGALDWLGNPAEANAKLAWVREVSPFMRTRGDTLQREINEIRNRVSEKGPMRKGIEKVVGPDVAEAVADSYFVLIAKAQLVADIPTWLGQYLKSVEAGESPDRAVALADQAVIDAQTSGQIKDLAGVQRGGPMRKLWTNFYSYFSGTYNLLADRTADLKRRGPTDLAYYAVDVAMLTVLPATITSLMFQLLRGDDDDEWEDIAKNVAADNVNYMFGLMIGSREIGGAISGAVGYSGPAGARVFGELGRLGKQVSQGEADEALLRSVNSVAGVLLHYPSGQIDKTVRGLRDLANGDAGPAAPLVGPPVKNR